MKKLIEYYSSPAMGNFTIPEYFNLKRCGKFVPAAGSNKTKSTNRQKPKKR
tara:strand:+ start:108 stop:260 length:153 start_codon:yes stop_codon:yes gene_type:complete